MLTCALNLMSSWLRLSFVFLESSSTIFGEVSPPRVGVGVVERGGLARLDTGDVALETILDPGTEAEKNFLDEPNTGLKDLEALRVPHCELPFGIELQLKLVNFCHQYPRDPIFHLHPFPTCILQLGKSTQQHEVVRATVKLCPQATWQKLGSTRAATQVGTSLDSLSPCPSRPLSPSPHVNSFPDEQLLELEFPTMTSTTAALCQTPQAARTVRSPLRDSTSLGLEMLFLSPWPRTPKVPSPKVNNCPAEVTTAVCQGPQEINETWMPSKGPFTLFGTQ
nr:hypothetical protein Iba_chr12eCG16080 [Ipomoea batatas]